MLTVYVWTSVNSDEAQQVRELREELDSLSDRGDQLQHKIDSLNRLGEVGSELVKDTSLATSDNTLETVTQ
ncbi:MAG: hypothetical protein AAF944_18430 [Bacteroidota bacterium]